MHLISSRIKLFLKNFRHSLPSVCCFCADYHRGEYGLCDPCLQLLNPLAITCSICKLPLPEPSFNRCGHCIKKRPYYDQVFSKYRYEEPLKTVIRSFKYYEGLCLQSLLLRILLEALPSAYKPDCLVAVPIHPQRLRARGFNQSALLTQVLAEKINVPHDLTLCQKIKNTQAQAQLNRKQRQVNLRNSFVIKENHYQHVAIVDDLLTTGSTVNELARCLKKTGIKRVDILCCARTPS